jgi:hypothetical protein
MTTLHHVPADDEAETIVDLVHDCREISGVLGSFVPATIRIPSARDALPYSVPVEISLDAVNALVGYDEYGS